VKRDILCNDYSNGGLRMIDPMVFSQAQKLAWVKLLLDPTYVSFWKSLELSTLVNFNPDHLVLWKTEAPNSILNSLSNCQLSESIRLWYLYRDKVRENLGWSDFHFQDFIWWNKNIRLKSKTFFFYPVWFEKGILTISDLYLGRNLIKPFEELVIEFDIPIHDRRKYNSLMKGIDLDWFYNNNIIHDDIFDHIVNYLLDTRKVPRHAYSILRDVSSTEKSGNKWIENLDIMEEFEWDQIHNNNFTCTIETQLRAFYFKIFHRAVCTNQFLHKIGRAVSPNCHFCDESPESLLHLLCDCRKISPLWDDLCFYINNVTNNSFIFSKFDKMFGIVDESEHDKCITFLFLCLKFYIHRCRFQQSTPNFRAFFAFIKMKCKVEFQIAEKNNKLNQHFKKWTINLEA